MSFGMRLLMGLAALLMVSGFAAAQCPECDPDGTPGSDGSYTSIDLGAVDEHVEGVADTDASIADKNDPEGFWAWLSICLTVFVAHIEEALGVETGLDASADAYVSEHGADLDAGVTAPAAVCDAVAEACAVDFDESEVGDLDGMTWDAMADLHEAAGEDVLLDEVPVDGEAVDGLLVHACITAELTVITC